MQYKLGNTLQLLKLYEEAIICYNEAIRLSSLNSKAINNKGFNFF
jgi:tetratricopeptide (TPR) repeat protein